MREYLRSGCSGVDAYGSESHTDESGGVKETTAMLSMAGVSRTGLASLGCERVGVVIDLSPITRLNPSVCSGSWGSRTNSNLGVEVMKHRSCAISELCEGRKIHAILITRIP